MKDNIYLLAFGTFGNPNGFRQSPFIAKNKNVFDSIKTFDLNTNAIKLFPNNKLYSIRKEVVNGLNSVAYTTYSFAKEQNSDRGGTFIGSSILFINEIPDENIIIAKLIEFQKKLVEKNVQNDVILVNHSNSFSVDLPVNFDKIEHNHRKFDDLTHFISSNENLVVFCETKPDKLSFYFKNALKLLNKYDCIYFTADEEIATFVNNKQIFKLIQNVGDKREFENEIKILEEEKLKKIQSSISEYEKEKERFEQDKRKQIADFKEQIERNNKVHSENQQKIISTKNIITDLEQKYSKFYTKINEAISMLKAEKSIDEVRRFHSENKSEFTSSINNIQRIDKINFISTPRQNTGSQMSDQAYFNEQNEQPIDKHTKPKEDNFNKKIFSSILTICFLLICSNIYFATKKVELKPQEETYTSDEDIDETYENIRLYPIPNSELSASDKKKVFEANIKGKTLDSITGIIFSKNPTEIASLYIYQKINYKPKLYESNIKCFEIKRQDTLCTCNSLEVIPSFKKPIKDK